MIIFIPLDDTLKQKIRIRLPKENMDELAGLVGRIPSVPFFAPDLHPRESWITALGRDFPEARLVAHEIIVKMQGGNPFSADIEEAERKYMFEKKFEDAMDAAEAAARVSGRHMEIKMAGWVAENAAFKAASRVGGSERHIAFLAGMDFRLRAYTIVVKDMPGMNGHARHAEARTDGWEKGYEVMGEINGKLIVAGIGTERQKSDIARLARQ